MLTRTVYPTPEAIYSRYDRHGELCELRTPDYIDVKECGVPGPTGEPIIGGRVFITLAARTADSLIVLQMESRAWRELAMAILESCDEHEEDIVPAPNTAEGFDPRGDVCANSWHPVTTARNRTTAECRDCREILTITTAPNGRHRLPIHNTPPEQGA